MGGDNKDKDRLLLSEFEEIVLLAVFRLRDDAYGVPVRQAVAEATERDTAIGSVYVTLERLEKKGFVTSKLGEATSERGGRAKRYFHIEGAGVSALNEMEDIRQRLRHGASLPQAGLQPV